MGTAPRRPSDTHTRTHILTRTHTFWPSQERPTSSLTTSTAPRGSTASMAARERSITTANSLMRARSIPVDRPSDAVDGERPAGGGGRTGKKDRGAAAEEDPSGAGTEDAPKEARVRGGASAGASKKLKMSSRSKDSRGAAADEARL